MYNIASSANKIIFLDINHSPSEMELTDVMDIIKKHNTWMNFLERKK